MFTIRREQLTIFENESWRRLAEQSARHLRTYFPNECEAMGQQTLAAHIDEGILRARRHGLELTYDFLRYLNLTIVFGRDFDEKHPWAAEILTRHEFGAHTRMELLAQGALGELGWVEEESEEDSEGSLEGPAAVEEEAVEPDGLADEEPGKSKDGDEPEPLQWAPEEPPIERDLDPDVDYTAHESDLHDG